jgi:hypothetical protein
MAWDPRSIHKAKKLEMKLILSFFLLMRLIFVSGRDEIVVEKLLAALKISLEEITSQQSPEAVVYGLKKTGVA